MKKLSIYAISLAALLIAGNLVSCESNKKDDSKEAMTDLSDSMGDSKDMAENQNDEKFKDSPIKDDARFAVAAADGGMLEIELARLAQSNASSEVVKEFSKHIIEDHSKANEEMKAIALSKSISLPDALSEKNLKEVDKLSKKTGADFDKDYIDFMVSDHKEDIKDFEKEAEKGNDPEIKAFASEKLPTLKHHLQMAEDTKAALKK
ncbi:MAG: outer membrane protein-like protein [Chitinophagaceae bacterium]|nr:outer membrane protein-like protein [Chitinophagaceae bacterium]